MKLIVDTNILLKALIKDSRVRAILLSPVDQFLVPEFASRWAVGVGPHDLNLGSVYGS